MDKKQSKTKPEQNQALSQEQKKDDDRFLDPDEGQASDREPQRDQDQTSRQLDRTPRDLNTNVR